MTRVDLDAIERNAKLNVDSSPATVLALAAELRAARKVVEAAKAQDADIYRGDRDRLAEALATYDQAVAS